MDTDNLYPRATNIFKPDKKQEAAKSNFQQQIARRLEKIGKEKPYIERACEHLRAKVEFYKSIESVPHESLFDRRKMNHVLAANKIIVECLSAELGRLEGVLRQYDEMS